MQKLLIGIGAALIVGCTPASQGTAPDSTGSSASCHSGPSCQNIGLRYAGRGDQKNYAAAAKYFQRACDYGLSEGCNNIAFLYANARGVKQSYTLAYKYWGKACSMGNASACANLDLAKDKVAAMHRSR